MRRVSNRWDMTLFSSSLNMFRVMTNYRNLREVSQIMIIINKKMITRRRGMS